MSRYVPKHLRQAGAENAEVYAPGHTPSTGAEIKSVTYEHGVAAADAYGKTTASNAYVQGGPFSYYEDLLLLAEHGAAADRAVESPVLRGRVQQAIPAARNRGDNIERVKARLATTGNCPTIAPPRGVPLRKTLQIRR